MIKTLFQKWKGKMFSERVGVAFDSVLQTDELRKGHATNRLTRLQWLGRQPVLGYWIIFVCPVFRVLKGMNVFLLYSFSKSWLNCKYTALWAAMKCGIALLRGTLQRNVLAKLSANSEFTEFSVKVFILGRYVSYEITVDTMQSYLSRTD